MENKNYFTHFGVEPSFTIDTAQLKKQFLKLSREYHPDFHTEKSDEEQAEILQLSSYNNKAFKVLKDFDARFKYILLLHGVDFEEGKQSLPQMFLMEMMDFNEKLMDVQMEGDLSQLESLKAELKEIEESLYSGVSSTIENYNPVNISESELARLKEYFFKKKYLLRIHENLNKFANS